MNSVQDCCKAGRVAADYGFRDMLDENLGAKWEAEDGPGLRPLARSFNTQVIHEGLLRAGEHSLDGEAALLYRLLTDDEVEEAERARTCQRLAEQNIDPDDLLESLVSYRTIDRHFQHCTGRERRWSDHKVTESETLDRINALKNRLERVTGTALDQVLDEAASDSRPLDVMVQVTVICSDCGSRLPVREFLADGCRCKRPSLASSGPVPKHARSAGVEVIPQQGESNVE